MTPAQNPSSAPSASRAMVGLGRLSATLAVVLALAVFLLYGEPSGHGPTGPVVFAATSAGP